MRRGDLLLAVSVPVLLAAGLLPWQRNRMCTAAGCGTVQAGAWSGSLAWTVSILAGLALAALWVLLVPARGRVPTAVAALTLGVAVLATVVVGVSLDALVFGRTGLVTFQLPVAEEFPVLSVRPAEGLWLGLLGLLLQAAAGWTTLRHRGALVSPLGTPAARTPTGALPAHGPVPTGAMPPGPVPAHGPTPTGPVPTHGPVPTGPVPPVGVGPPPPPHRRRRH